MQLLARIQSLGQSPAVAYAIWLSCTGDPKCKHAPARLPQYSRCHPFPCPSHIPSCSSQLTMQSVCEALDFCNARETKRAKLSEVGTVAALLVRTSQARHSSS